MPGIERIAAERHRQIEMEGWTPSRDAKLYAKGQLAKAATCYLVGVPHAPNASWPWHPSWWKPTTRIRDLEKAGALIAAEIDRLLAEEGGR